MRCEWRKYSVLWPAVYGARLLVHGSLPSVEAASNQYIIIFSVWVLMMQVDILRNLVYKLNNDLQKV